jgi:hypothetical protein
LYAGWAVGGYASMAAVVSLTVALGCAAWYYAMPRVGRDPFVWSIGSLVWIAAMQGRVMPRAQVFSIALFVVMLALLERLRTRLRTEESIVATCLAIVATEFVWMNLHRGGIHGLVLLTGFACFAVASALGSRFRLAERITNLGAIPARRLAIVVALPVVALIAGALNPSGWAVYTTGVQVSNDPIHRGLITEWLPLSVASARTLYPVATIALAAGVLVAIGIFATRVFRRRPSPVDVWHVGVTAVFARQGLASARWMTDAASAAMLPLFLWLGPKVRENPYAGRISLHHPVTLLVFGATLLLAGQATNPSTFGLGAQRDRYPELAITFAANNELGPRVHNTFVYGGPLVWFGRDHFLSLVDGRNDMVFPSEFFARCSRAQHDVDEFTALIAEYPADWVLADNTPGRETFVFLAYDPGWAQVFWSEAAVVYVRAEVAASRGLSGYRYLRPANEVGWLQQHIVAAAGSADVLRGIEAELQRANSQAGGDSTSLASFRVGALLALLYHATGAHSQADAVVHLLVTQFPDHPALADLIAVLNPTSQL